MISKEIIVESCRGVAVSQGSCLSIAVISLGLCAFVSASTRYAKMLDY